MNEENNLKQKQNTKPEMLTDQNIEIKRKLKNLDKEKRDYFKSIRCLQIIKKANENGIALRNTRIIRQKHQAVVNKYLKERSNNPQERPPKRRVRPVKLSRRRRKILIRPDEDTFSNLRPFYKTIEDPFCLAVARRSGGRNEPLRTEWPSIESDLMELITAHNLKNKNGPILRYDTEEVHRGFRIIKCMDEFSKDFICNSFRKIADKWKELKLRLIPAAKIPKFKRIRPYKLKETPTDPHLTIRPISEVITDPLCLALAGEKRGNDIPIRSEWPSIESDLMELLADYNITNKNGPVVSYDTTEVHRGFRIIKCMDEFSKQFMYKSFQKIAAKWKKLRLRLIPAANIPKFKKEVSAIPKETPTNPNLSISALSLALAGERQGNVVPIRSEWPSIESHLMKLVADYNIRNKNGPILSYDTTEVHQGFRIIKCMNEFSKKFMYSSLSQISGKWKGMRLRLIPAANIPKVEKEISEETLTNPPLSIRRFSDVITDPLCLALAGERGGYDLPIRFEWPSIESDLMELVADYNLRHKNGPVVSYDTTEIHRGFRIIKCINEFSKEFIYGCFNNKLCKKWKFINLKLIPAENLPKKLRKPLDLGKETDLSNAQYIPNHSKRFGKSNNEPTISYKPESPASSAPTAPFWPDKFESINKLRSVNDNNKDSEPFKQLLNAIKHTNKQEDFVIEPTHKRNYLEHRQYSMETPQTSRNSLLQNSTSYRNPFRHTGFQLSDSYDSTDEKGNSYCQDMEWGEHSLNNPNFQQNYPEISWESSYNRMSPNFLEPGREIELPERYREIELPERYREIEFPERYREIELPERYREIELPERSERERERERKQKYSEGWQKYPDQNPQENYDLNYDKFFRGPSNFTSNYGPTYEDTTFSTNSPPSTFTQRYSFGHQSQNFVPSDDDERPPPPPSFRIFDDYDDPMERSRERRRRSYRN